MVTNTSSDLPSLIFAQRRDGRRIPVEVTVSPIRNAGGQVIGGIEVFRDLSPAFEDLNRARLIQQEAVGMNLPDDDRVDITVRYTPHDLVGGDFYRVEWLHRDVYAIMLADVVGHGVAAALYAMELRSLWEGGRSRLEQPAEFLQWLSRRVEPLTDHDAGYFATAVQVVYHAGTGQFEIGTAGHPPPLIVRRDGRREPLQSSGPGLGLLPQPVFQTVTGQLDPGDQLLLFTDGALEILNESGEELDEQGFFDLVGKTDLKQGAEGLLQLEVSLLTYSNKLSLPDDMTLILLQRRT
jgi:serine phosphatase RsbU (regulator of sigma subunit)